ncbi:hypothetical protein OS493_038351 [Desmophyllum pertusum]|uniref:Uncharacterized protein n=1 Tax=Desmophyllum pertusum TaxID=174260 RepID=A0A9W9YHI6_9CNID|nr:hypothetical protein OS493_038351 [Desmophyllum pertusum]
MPEKKNLAIGRIKTVRQGHRTTVKRILYTVDEHLEAPSFEQLDNIQRALHVSKLHQQRDSLRSKLETVKALDAEILALVEDDDIEEEIQEANLISEMIEFSIKKIDAILESNSKTPAKTSTSGIINHWNVSTPSGKAENPLTPPEIVSTRPEQPENPLTPPEILSTPPEKPKNPLTSPEIVSNTP